MKTVRLPIYEDGVETNEVLEVSVKLLQKLGASSIVFKDHVMVVPKETKDAFTGQKVAEVEMETINRIISGLPPQPVFEEFEVPFDKNYYHIQPEPKRILKGLSVEEAQERGYFATPPGRPYADWRKIPGLEGYTMNPRKIIINDATDQTVSQEIGGQGAKVLLTDDEGVARRFSVDFLFHKTFPELNK